MTAPTTRHSRTTSTGSRLGDSLAGYALEVDHVTKR